MKRVYFTIGFTLCCAILFAQLPQAINFQGVAVKDGKILTNTDVGITLTIIDSAKAGQVVYEEFHGATTNEFGSFSLEVGTSKKVIGSQKFEDIEWHTGKKYMNVVIDLTANQSDPIDLGTLEMVTVPFAFAAESVTNIHDDGAEKGDVLVFNGENWVPRDTVEYSRITGMINETGVEEGQFLRYDGDRWSPSKSHIKIKQVNSSYTVLLEDEFVAVDVSMGNTFITLPDPGLFEGMLTFQMVGKKGNNKCTILGQNDTIVTVNGSDIFEIELWMTGEMVELYSDGHKWIVKSMNSSLYVLADQSYSQKILPSTFTVIDFDNLKFDSHATLGSWFEAAPGHDGTYYIDIAVGFKSNSSWDIDEYAELSYKTPMPTEMTFAKTYSSGGNEMTLNGSFLVKLYEGHWLEMRIFHNSGSTLELDYAEIVIRRISD